VSGKDDLRRARSGALDPFAIGAAVAVAGLLIPLTLAPGPVAAAEISPAVTAATCSACHGPDGKSAGSIPSLNELDFASLDAKLKSFRAGELAATVMTRIAKGFTDSEIESLARYMAAR
jgi:cytochrome c553